MYRSEMARATRAILLATLHRHLPEITDQVSEATLAAIPAYAEFDEDLRCTTGLTVRSFIEHVEGKRNELNHSLIEYARQLARRGVDGGTLAHSWRVVNHELWVWLTTKCPTEFDLQGDGLAVWNELLDVHERYVGASMDAFFETQSELRASELACRHASLDSLLDGRASDQTSTMLKVLGIRSEQVLIVRCSFTGAGPNDPAEPSSKFEPLIREIQAHTRRLPWTVSDGRLVLCLPHDHLLPDHRGPQRQRPRPPQPDGPGGHPVHPGLPGLRDLRRHRPSRSARVTTATGSAIQSDQPVTQRWAPSNLHIKQESRK